MRGWSQRRLVGHRTTSVLLKLYIYGYLNRVQSSRRLEREAGRNVEVMWLLGRLAPDHKTIADFCKDNGLALRRVCACQSFANLTGVNIAGRMTSNLPRALATEFKAVEHHIHDVLNVFMCTSLCPLLRQFLPRELAHFGDCNSTL
ncbi:Icc-related predicted phosphoesterase [Bradyrhizobium sp. JR3.5]